MHPGRNLGLTLHLPSPLDRSIRIQRIDTAHIPRQDLKAPGHKKMNNHQSILRVRRNDEDKDISVAFL
jgi:hypothetical protein